MKLSRIWRATALGLSALLLGTTVALPASVGLTAVAQPATALVGKSAEHVAGKSAILASAETSNPLTIGETKVDAEAALAFDLASGQVLYARNIDTPRPIASLTKLLAVELVLDAIQSGKLKWTDTVTATPSIAALTRNPELANVPLRDGVAYTIKDLYQATLIASANSAVMLLGNAVSGSQAAFIDQMRDKLADWGIADATIVTISGLDNDALAPADRYPGSQPSDVNKMSARDYAKLMTHLLADHPEVLETTKLSQATFAAGTPDQTAMTNFNKMLPGLPAAQADLPVDGLKTGTSDGAGPSFAGTLKNRAGARIGTVVLHANGTSPTTRFDETTKMLREVEKSYTVQTVATENEALSGVEDLEVPDGEIQSVALVAAKKVTVYVPKGKTPDWSLEQVKPNKQGRLAAPVDKGDSAGEARLSLSGGQLAYLDKSESVTVPLKTQQEVKEANFFVKLWRAIVNFFSHLFS